MIQKAIGALFVFLLAPAGLGFLAVPGKQTVRRFFSVYLAGFLMELALFQLIAVPIILQKGFAFPTLVTWFTAALLVFMAAGFVLEAVRFFKRKTGKKQGEMEPSKEKVLKKAGIGNWFAGLRGDREKQNILLFWILAAAAVLFQMYMAYAYASFDGDDAYYVVESLLADETNTMYLILPYTGLSTNLDVRHALATIPMWEAYIARITGIHATIVAHSLIPLVLIPVTYLLYAKIGIRLLGKNTAKVPLFLCFVSILQIWGNTSIYTNATFFLTRTWQGKSILCNLVILAAVWIFLHILSEEQRGSRAHWWLLLVCTNIVAAMATTMGAFLIAVLVCLTGLVAAVQKKKPVLCIQAGLCCIPNILYLLLYLFLVM